MLSFKDFYIIEMADKTNRPERTQVATTGGTYRKTGAFLKDKLQPQSRIISIGAGLDQTKENLINGLNSDGANHDVHDHEPYPEKRKAPPEYTNASHIPSNHYHAAVTHNVLNVLQPEDRENIMHHLFRTVKEGGHMVIGTRGYKGDISLAKSTEPGDEPGSVWVSRKTKNPKTGKSEITYSYQKGFDGDELKNYVEEYAKKHGHEVKVKKIGGMAKNTVHVQLLSKAKPKQLSLEV